MKVKTNKAEAVVVLDNIRSVLNVGSIFRTSDAVGVSKIYLCGCSPTPLDRFNRPRKDLAKTALGAEGIIPWEYQEKTVDIIKKLKKEGYQIISVELAENSVDYKKVKVENKVAFVMGNEVDGVDKKVLKLSDVVAEIPMLGEKESLNVGVSFGIVAFRILNK
jgi:23S rRNA (guanosine2251-2'-O)-methyltransferase